MKKFLAIISLALASSLAFGAETEKICVNKTTKDGKPILDKAGKPQQECKLVKIHKKLEGTKVPVPEKK
jgi:hypothetical protein